jgi:hypothetical protein
VDEIDEDTVLPDALTPVRCTFCRQVYDLAAVTPKQRYADCTTYLTPCCGRAADDREGVSLPAFRRLRAG